MFASFFHACFFAAGFFAAVGFFAAAGAFALAGALLRLAALVLAVDGFAFGLAALFFAALALSDLAEVFFADLLVAADFTVAMSYFIEIGRAHV